jgi:SAM-dependent methyltransferase
MKQQRQGSMRRDEDARLRQAERAHGEGPAAWLRNHVQLLRQNPVTGPVLDVACGEGLNVVFLAENGLQVEGVDASAEALARARERAVRAKVNVRLRQADLEKPDFSLPREAYAAIIVFRYLHRPLIPVLKAALKAGGLIVYETFTERQRVLGKPKNPDFLLKEGELRALFADFEIVAAFEGLRENPLRHMAAIVARKPQSTTPRTGPKATT